MNPRDVERMRMDTTESRSLSSARPIIIGIVAAFVLGGAIAGYGVWRYGGSYLSPAREQAPPVTLGSPLPTTSPTPLPSASASGSAQVVQAVQAAQIVAEQQGGLDQRIAAAEQRIARLDLQAQAASGNAARAEGLLIAFSARRTLERGRNLGVLTDQLRLRFGDAMPNAVQTIIDFGRQPITLDQLLARLDGLAPQLAQTNRQFSWRRVREELSQLFVVRRETTPSPQPRRRLDRAKLFLQTGRVAEAVAEVRNLPGVANASGWIRDAERYAAAQNALDRLETAAVLEPRNLRDGEGRALDQAGLIDGTTPPAQSGAQ